jgi:NAD(P)-dependent dehydrogenase (short-subunit alcohol dehydrogenase family)
LKRLLGKVALITGGAYGIGEASVRKAINEGANVVIADKYDLEGENLVKEFNVYEKRAVYHHVDVTKEDQVKAMVERAVKEFGKLDVVLNNAGINMQGLADEKSQEKFKKSSAIIPDEVSFVVKHSAQLMKKNGGGSIVNSVSIFGHNDSSNITPYLHNKDRVHTMTKTFAEKFAKYKIRVNSIRPAFIHSTLINTSNQESFDNSVSYHSNGKPVKPEDFAKIFVFLASDDPRFMTGLVFNGFVLYYS